MQYTDYSSVAVWAYTGLVAFIVSLISTIRSFLSTQISSEKSVSFPGISPLGQRAKIKQFQRAYLAREVFLKKKDQNKKAYNLALLLDMCNANNAKELMKDLMSDTEAQRKAIFKSRKMIYEPVVKNPFLKGESFILGRYMYGKNKSVKPIEWIVIDVRDDSLLLLSKYALDKKQYAKNEGSNHTWSASFIRDWLNHSFYDSSFTTKEKEIIQETKIQSFPSTHTAASRYRPSNLDYNSDIEATIDKVFLLDAKEVELVPIKERTAKPTPYFESQFFDCVTDYSVGSYSDHPKYARNWILRNLSYSPRFSSWWYPDEVEFDTLSKQAIVKEALNISSEATIRPAIIVSLRPGEIRT